MQVSEDKCNSAEEQHAKMIEESKDGFKMMCKTELNKTVAKTERQKLNNMLHKHRLEHKIASDELNCCESRKNQQKVDTKNFCDN